MTSNNNKVDTDSAGAHDKGVGCMNGSADFVEARGEIFRKSDVIAVWTEAEREGPPWGRVTKHRTFIELSAGIWKWECSSAEAAEKLRDEIKSQLLPNKVDMNSSDS